ncbi:MAG: pyridoxamine 5'-phosphate oxidase family protein [Oligoflexia bacterium]|nr:pyridoxamine 5'-phosphate oxidase family protein [Oligoflexia bacterium]
MEEALKKLGQLIDGIEYAMLTTVRSDGNLHSRPMATRQLGEDGELWFLTARSSLKVTELGKDQRVNLSYAEPSSHRYVSITGTAEVLDDRDKVRELWNPTYSQWFPKGVDDPDIAVLKISVEDAEYWDRSAGQFSRLLGLIRPTPAAEHRRIGLAG